MVQALGMAHFVRLGKTVTSITWANEQDAEAQGLHIVKIANRLALQWTTSPAKSAGVPISTTSQWCQRWTAFTGNSREILVSGHDQSPEYPVKAPKKHQESL